MTHAISYGASGLYCLVVNRPELCGVLSLRPNSNDFRVGDSIMKAAAAGEEDKQDVNEVNVYSPRFGYRSKREDGSNVREQHEREVSQENNPKKGSE